MPAEKPFYKRGNDVHRKISGTFFPFDKLDVIKHGIESMWNIENDRVMMALAMTMMDKPMAVNMSFQREYAAEHGSLWRQCAHLSYRSAG